MLFYRETNSKSGIIFRVCLDGGGGPQVACQYNFLFYFDHVCMIGGVGRVTLSAICYVNVSRRGNPPSRGSVHGKKIKSEICMF